MRLLKFTFTSIVMADNTCSNANIGKDGECAEDMSVLQVHEHKYMPSPEVEDGGSIYPDASSFIAEGASEEAVAGRGMHG